MGRSSKNTSRTTQKKEDFSFSDDCAICQAMKEGKASTEEELREAFRKAEERKRAKEEPS